MAQSWLTQLAVLGLVLSMLGMGMTLAPADFLRIARQPRATVVGLFAQVVALPLLAFAIALLTAPGPVVAIALIALAACPGGASSNSLTFLARGDVPLSISLTAANSLLSFATTPFVIGLGIAAFGADEVAISLSFRQSTRLLLLQVVLPVAIGMLVAGRAPALAGRLAKPLVYAGLGCIVVPTLAIPFRGGRAHGGDLLTNVALTGLLNVGSMLVALALASAARLSWPQRRTIMIEVGIQNFGLFIVISALFLRDERVLAAGIPYLFWMLGSAVALAMLQRREAVDDA